MKYFALATLWVIWGAIHSGMISVTATEYLKHRFGGRFRFYRLVFNLVALVALIPVVIYGESIRGQVVFRWEGLMVIFQMLVLAVSVLLFVAGARHYDMLQFLGLRQIRTGASPSVLTETGKLDMTGILGITRHPWYMGAILFMWVAYRSLDVSTLVTNIVLTIYLIVGTVLEERKLLMEYGEEYRRYQNRVSMLVPFKYLKGMISKAAL